MEDIRSGGWKTKGVVQAERLNFKLFVLTWDYPAAELGDSIYGISLQPIPCMEYLTEGAAWRATEVLIKAGRKLPVRMLVVATDEDLVVQWRAMT